MCLFFLFSLVCRHLQLHAEAQRRRKPGADRIIQLVLRDQRSQGSEPHLAVGCQVFVSIYSYTQGWCSWNPPERCWYSCRVWQRRPNLTGSVSMKAAERKSAPRFQQPTTQTAAWRAAPLRAERWSCTFPWKQGGRESWGIHRVAGQEPGICSTQGNTQKEGFSKCFLLLWRRIFSYCGETLIKFITATWICVKSLQAALTCGKDRKMWFRHKQSLLWKISELVCPGGGQRKRRILRRSGSVCVCVCSAI